MTTNDFAQALRERLSRRRITSLAILMPEQQQRLSHALEDAGRWLDSSELDRLRNAEAELEQLLDVPR